MNRTVAVSALAAAVLLLAGCASPEPSPTASPTAEPSPSTSQSSAPSLSPFLSPSVVPEAEFEIATLTDEDILATMESGCAIQLFRDGAPTDLIYYEGIEKAIMKIDGAVLPFLHIGGSTLGDPIIRSLEGPENGYVLDLDTPFGEASPETDSTAIPAGTLTISPNGGTPVTVEVNGGVAC